MLIPRLAHWPASLRADELWNLLPNSTELPFHQAWRSEPELGLMPGAARFGWHETGLLIAARLSDRDIFNPETRFNVPQFTVGDVAEIFLRAMTGEVYHELHVTPDNAIFQLRIPSAAQFKAITSAGGGINSFKVSEPIFTSDVAIDRAAQRWSVAFAIPFAAVGAVGCRAWTVNVCRYDYTRGASAPVLSSICPLTKLNYHHQDDWLPVTLVD